MKRAKATPNYDILFASAVSRLQSTHEAYKDVKRELLDLSLMGRYNKDGEYCITLCDYDYVKDLVAKEQYITEQLQYCIQEVDRLRTLKNKEKENETD